jgi:hypothetical protein
MAAASRPKIPPRFFTTFSFTWAREFEKITNHGQVPEISAAAP